MVKEAIYAIVELAISVSIWVLVMLYIMVWFKLYEIPGFKGHFYRFLFVAPLMSLTIWAVKKVGAVDWLRYLLGW